MTTEVHHQSYSHLTQKHVAFNPYFLESQDGFYTSFQPSAPTAKTWDFLGPKEGFPETCGIIAQC